ncbi:MAG: transposase [Actinomycetota bacterium]|nr:transposase [Actinomycetota bacterium]
MARRDLRRRGIRAIIPQKRNEHPAYLMDWTAYRERNRIERLVNRFKQCRRIATRYDKLAGSYGAFVMLTAIRMWL